MTNNLSTELGMELPEETRFKGVAIHDSYTMLSEYKRDVKLPSGIKFRLGCLNCEFRDMGICPFGFKRGKGYHDSKNSHTRGICEFRRGYLKSFIRGDSKKVSENKFWLDYNKGIAQDQLQREQANLFKLNKSLLDLEEQGVKGADASRIKKEYFKAREQWFDLWKGLAQLEDKAVDRDTPKNVNLNTSTLSLHDIHRVMATDDKVLEAEWTSKEN